MTKIYSISYQAKQDVKDIFDYIAQDNTGAAEGVLESFYAAFALLAEHPYVGHTRSDLTKRDLRFWAVHNYLIIYLPKSDRIEIVHVMSGYRDLETLLDDEL